jgi:hypothetical protein
MATRDYATRLLSSDAVMAARRSKNWPTMVSCAVSS